MCKGHVEITDILEHNVGGDNIFFIETSERKTLTPREACSIESAARYMIRVRFMKKKIK